MIFSIFKKKKIESKIYPGFNTRLIAAMIDLAIAAIIIIPISLMISYNIYDDLPPSQELKLILSKSLNNASDYVVAKKQLDLDPEYQKFMLEKGYGAIFIEQSIQIVLLAIVIFICWLKMASTPGKMIFSLKIVNAKDFSNPNIVQLLVRLFSYAFSMLPLGLGVFYILFNKQKRSWHDLISDTVVISTKHIKDIPNKHYAE